MFPIIRKNNNQLATRHPTHELSWCDPFTTLRNHFDDVFSLLSSPTTNMPIRMWEKEDKLYVEADLAGVSKDDVDVSIDNRTLRIAASRHETCGGDGKNHYNETYYGKYERSLTIPESVDPDSCKAELVSGVLKLTFTKAENTKTRKIEVT